jgi:heme/copper-type cytochrome/quinol oxidase subunit 3
MAKAPVDPFANPFETKEYNPEQDREKIRGQVALAAAITFFAVVFFYLFQATRATDQWPQVKEAMQSVLPAVTSVLGTVVGFYFGSQKR